MNTRPPVAFSSIEFQRRIALVRERMARAGIDVLLVCDPSNINYLTGYDAASYYIPQMALLDLHGEEPLWVGRKMDVACARYTAFMQEQNLIGYPESYIGVHDKHAMEFVAELFRERGWAELRIGVEMDTAPLTPRALDRLRQLLPRACFVDAELLVNYVRLIKSDAEIVYMKQAAQISQRAMQVAFEIIEPGVRECDAAARIMAALIAGTEQYAGHLTMQGAFSMPSGERTSAPHLAWTEAPFRSQQLTSIELGGCRYAYHAGLSRSFFLGTPPRELSYCADVTLAGMSAVLERMRAGTTCGEVADHWNEILKQAALQKESRIGYSIGIGYPLASWIDRAASLQSGDATVMQPNMTFHIILGMWMDRWGFEVSETVRITDGMPEVFAKFPRALMVKP